MKSSRDKSIKRVILALDDMEITSAEKLFDEMFQSKDTLAAQMISMIKLNDMVHGQSIDALEELMEHVPIGIELFLDLKLADVSGTCKNIAKRYVRLDPRIITVRENIDWRSLEAIHEVLPDTIIALVCALTDISEADFVRDYKMPTHDYIANHIEKFNQCMGIDSPLGAFVCSPLEVMLLKERYPHYQAIVPGVRDVWMETAHQKRVMGVADTLCAGADFVVMGAQLLKGNPLGGTSAEVSLQLTYNNIIAAMNE